MFDHHSTRKRKSRQLMLRASRSQDLIWVDTEVARAQGRCQALLGDDEYALLVAHAQAGYLAPWDRLRFWTEAARRAAQDHIVVHRERCRLALPPDEFARLEQMAQAAVEGDEFWGPVWFWREAAGQAARAQ